MAYEDGIHKQIEKTKNRLTNIDEAWYIKKKLNKRHNRKALFKTKGRLLRKEKNLMEKCREMRKKTIILQ